MNGPRLVSTRIALVIYDCDGVLIDSEALCDRVVSAELHRAGWALSPADCHTRFLGLTFPDIRNAAAEHLGRSVEVDWVDTLIRRVTAVMAAEAEAMPGAREALEATSALGLPFRIASNSSHTEMAAKFLRAGLSELVEGRVHSAYDMIALGKHGKPDPDLFLAAAAAQGVPPGSCLVVEDSLAGVRAAVAAGMTCLGISPDDDGEVLRQAGALPFRSMFALPDLLRSFVPGTR
jgi:HAD superfamily hydrolase (TIGR01509 family)